MIPTDFWTEWNRVSKREEAAIRSLRAARTKILKTIPNDEIMAVYAKGSLIRRELTDRSDVDTLTIVKHSRWLRALQKMQTRQQFEPAVCFSGYSLWELEHNKKSKAGKPDRGSPARTLTHLKHYKLIWGKPIKAEAFRHTIDEHAQLASFVHVFRTEFMPKYAQKRFAFADLVKQTFWLAENELRAQRTDPPHHWERLTKRFAEEHIIHDALRFRTEPTKDPNERAAYVEKLEAYLSALEAQHDQP
jgi:predicted nucleotidyltransferase